VELKVVGTSELRLESSTQVAKLAGRQWTSPCPRKVQRDDWDGITRAAMHASGRDGLPTHTTNCRPKIRRRFHGLVSFSSVFGYLKSAFGSVNVFNILGIIFV